MIKRFSAYDKTKDIIVTENGACFKNTVHNGIIDDNERVDYYQQYLSAMQKAVEEGIPVKEYLSWTLMDNFEWAEGYSARFGLIHVDFKTQLRTAKNSGFW